MEWRHVVGYESIYEISSEGKVRTVVGKTTHSTRHGVRMWKQIELKDRTPNGRNCRVALWKNKESKDFLVHRIVAKSFLTEIEGKNCVNHKDGNPKNNFVSNLEWCNHKENSNHAFDNGLMKASKKTTLINTDSGEASEFRSLSKASEYLGRNNGYIHGLLKKGVTSYGVYNIIVNE